MMGPLGEKDRARIPKADKRKQIPRLARSLGRVSGPVTPV